MLLLGGEQILIISHFVHNNSDRQTSKQRDTLHSIYCAITASHC